MTLNEVADELYGLPPGEFTARRNARAKEVRSADRALADEIGKLRRPSVSAWLVNQLARERADLLDQLLELAAALREAQETLSGDALRALSAQRHRVVASLAAEARRLAAAAGSPVSDPVQRELEGTFEAALADPDAAQAVRSGRLTGALTYAGLGAAPAGAAAPNAAPPASPPATDESKREADERALQEPREALREAEDAAREADDAQAEAATREAEAEAGRDEIAQRVESLHQQLEDAQREEATSTRTARDARGAREAADRALRAARQRRDRAQETVDRLTPA